MRLHSGKSKKPSKIDDLPKEFSWKKHLGEAK